MCNLVNALRLWGDLVHPQMLKTPCTFFTFYAHGSELDSTTLKQYAAYIPLDYK